MSVQTGRMVSADEARGDVTRQSWGPSWVEDLQHTVVVQAEQIAAALAVVDGAVAGLIHHVSMEGDSPDYRTERGWRDVADLLKDLSRALGVSGE